MKDFLLRFATDESGATAVEYGLIVAFIAVAIVVGAGTLGKNLNNVFNNLSTKITVG
jgi:pilus assembly protein Flp/PilA